MVISRKSNLLMYVLIVASVFSICTSVFAANDPSDDVSYSFTIPASSDGYGNGYSSTQSRSTAEQDASWYLNFGYSGEGAGTITTMWLDKSGTPKSSPESYYQGHTYTTIVYTSVSGSVRIGAENNNYSTKSYTVSGSWDPAVY